jgi:sugar phosphate isomerase/epimerase
MLGRMSFSRCLSSLGCPEFSLEEMVALAAKHRIPAVELRALGGTVELPAYFAQHYGSLEKLAERMHASPVRIAGLNGPLRLVGGTPEEREQHLALAPWADAVGAEWLRVFDGGKNADAGELATATDTMAWWRRVRRERGWRTDILIESHDSLLTGEKIAHFLAVAPDAKLMWDAHHTWRKGGEDPVETWRAIKSSVVHIHVKDSVNVPSARHPFTYVLPGDGEFPVAPLLAALRADGYAGLVSFEWEKMWHPYLPPIEEALRVAAERAWW